MTIQATTKEDCLVHNTHVPKSHVMHLHHIRPKEYGGINRADNREVICPTGHYNVHELLDALLAWDTHYPDKTFPYDILRHYSMRERALALEGFKRIKEDTHRDPKWQGDKGKQEAPTGIAQDSEVAEADGPDGQRRIEGEDLEEEGLIRG